MQTPFSCQSKGDCDAHCINWKDCSSHPGSFLFKSFNSLIASMAVMIQCQTFLGAGRKKFVKLKHSYLYELVKKKSSWNQYDVVPGISATTWADFGSMWKTSELWKTCSSWNISQRDTKLIINGECKRLRSSGSSFVFWSWISVARCDSKYLVLIKIFLKIS